MNRQVSREQAWDYYDRLYFSNITESHGLLKIETYLSERPWYDDNDDTDLYHME